MNKKLLVSVLLCFFVFSLGTSAKEQKAKASVIEHLVWAQTGGKEENMYFHYPTDYTTREEFNSGPLLTFNVPASPKSEALFFETWAHGMSSWTKHMILGRWINAFILLEIISPIIPANIEIRTSFNLLYQHYKSSDGIYEAQANRGKRSIKFIMRKNNVDLWLCKYKDSEEYVSEVIIIPIINSLMDNGFDVEVYTEGFTIGVHQFMLAHLATEVTRLSKN